MASGEDSGSISGRGIDDLVREYGASIDSGLTTREAAIRLGKYGPNALEKQKTMGFAGVLMKELKEPMIILLIVIAVLYSIIGDPRDSVVIVVIVLLVVFIEAYNVNRARRSIEALRELTLPTSYVYRDGAIRKEKTENIVPGDIVVLSSGERVPADGRLLESYGLKVDESSLTGESFPVVKDFEEKPATTELADLSNMVFSGTLVVQGSGRFLATSTGKGTEIGHVSEMIEEAEEVETPLGKSIRNLTVVLAFVAVGFSLILPVIGFLEGQTLSEMLLTGLSMAFATVPEELPVLISITLAIGAYSLSRHNAVVKDLKAAETLGSVTVIATDKTGTITENSMSVGHMFWNGAIRDAEDPDNSGLARHVVLATGTLSMSHGLPSYKDPMEVASFEYSRKLGIDEGTLRKRFRILDEFSFDNRLKLSSYLYEDSENGMVLYVSGAPEVVLARSRSALQADGSTNGMDDEAREHILSAVEELSSMGERIIAIASREVHEQSDDRNRLEQELTFLGMISFIDPPRGEVRDAIRQCTDAGIRVIMLTGDHPRTARAIADNVGINRSGKVVTGREISSMDDSSLEEAVRNSSVFARITSDDKFRIVKILQKMGETVAVTGDGVNDSPALQNAEIGISMGIRGTEVAREASDMILLDDNFATIVQAVHEGREILYTLRKSLKYEISIKIALVMILVTPLLLSLPFPFSPIQIIVMELLMDVAALGGFLYEREESGLMKRPPEKRRTSFLDRGMTGAILSSAISMTAAVGGIYLYLYYSTGILIRAQTAAFATWILTQVFLALNLRTEKTPVFIKGIFSNRVISIWGILIVLALAVITVFPDLQILLPTSYLTYSDWILVAAGSAAATFWIEALKFYGYLRNRPGRRHGAATNT